MSGFNAYVEGPVLMKRERSFLLLMSTRRFAFMVASGVLPAVLSQPRLRAICVISFECKGFCVSRRISYAMSLNEFIRQKPGRYTNSPPRVPACAGRTSFPVRQNMQPRDGFFVHVLTNFHHADEYRRFRLLAR